MSRDPDPGRRVDRLIRANVRSRWVLLALALVLPFGFHLLLERQARRLEALGDHGVVGEAVLVRASHTIAYYEYDVDGVRHEWNVARRDLPQDVGTRFPIVYVPEDPTLSRPGADRARGTTEAASNRSFAHKLEAGVFAFFFLFFLYGEYRIRELREMGAAALTDPKAFKRHLALLLTAMSPFLVLIFGFHLEDARQKGESSAPVVLGVVLTLGILGGTIGYAARKGPEQASAQSARILRIVAPISFAIAAIRLIAWLAGLG